MHVFCALIGIGGGTGSGTGAGNVSDSGSDGSTLSKVLLAPFMVIPNAAKFQSSYFYKFSIDGLEVEEASDEALTGGSNGTDDVVYCEQDQMIKDILEEEEEEEELEQPDPEPITKIEEEIVEEIVYVDNVELEERERLLIRQRKMIQQYREEQESMKEEEEYTKQLEEYIREQEETVRHLLAGLQKQWRKYNTGKAGVEDLKNQLISVGRSLDDSAQVLRETGDIVHQTKGTMNNILNANPNDMERSSLMKLMYLYGR